MTTIDHKDLVAGDIHIAYQWSYADSTARLAAVGFVAADVGKLALQVDTSALWLLTDDSPITWKEVGGYVAGGTDVAVADGGTAASTASGARTNLGLTIGTNVQAWDADLDTWAGKTAPSGTVVGTSDSQTLTNKTLTAPTIADFTNAGHDHLDADDGGTLSAAAIASGTIATARLGSGTADGTTFLRGDQTYATPSGAGGGVYEDFDEGAAPGTPASAKVRLYAKADGLLYSKDDAGAETLVSGGTGGGGSSLTVEEVDGSPTDSAVTKIKFPNGTLSITSHEATYTPAGGGSAAISRGADGSRPSAGTAGTLYLPTDGFAAHEDNGTNWRQWGPLFPLTAPVDGDFAWINQGGASVTAQNSGIFLLAPNQGAADNHRIRKKAAPATPYTVTAYILPLIFGKSFQSCGLVWRQSSDGKLATLGVGFNGTTTPGLQLTVTKWTSVSAISANYTNTGLPEMPRWLRLRDDGTTRYTYLSSDGQNWVPIHSVGRTDFLTPDEIGFFVNANNNATPNLDAGMTLLSWVEA